MKKNSFILLCLLFTQLNSFSQEFSLKFGAVTEEEIAMTSYEKDTTANALIIYHKGDSYYDFIKDDFKVTYTYETKIKIFNQEGIEYADVVIPIYHQEKQNLHKEVISRLEAYAYNLENGKIVKTKMDKKYVYEERVSPFLKLVKFSIPSAKAGSIIEFKYKITSDYYTQLNDWDIQKEIPVHYAEYEIKIPEYFSFQVNSKGYEKIDVKETPENQTFMINLGGYTENITCSSRKMKFISNEVPALKDDGYIWCIDDFTSKITFELNGINFPYDIYRPLTNSWNNVEAYLIQNESWGKHLNFKNPYKEEMKKLPLEEMDNLEKIRAIFHLLRNNMKWNETYGLYSNDIRKAIKEGTGTNAEINFVLLSMLKDANITAHPIVLSRRSAGRLPLTHPSLRSINTFIVGAKTSDSTMVYLDGSVKYGDVNTLPPTLMTDRARVVDNEGGGYWTNLTKVGNHRARIVTSVSINEEGKLTGQRQSILNGLYASFYRKEFYEAKDSIEFLEELERDREIKISNFQHTGIEKEASEIKQTFNFEKEITYTDELIYFNPLIFPQITVNPFIEEERKLPVEFHFPYEIRNTVSITIPEEYEIEELPEQIKFGTEKGDIICRYTWQNNQTHLIINYTLQFNKVIYPFTEYPALKSCWEKLVEKNTEQIILKKKTIQ